MNGSYEPKFERIWGFVPRGFYTLLSKEVWRFVKVINQTIFAPVVTNCLYLTIFGVALKHRDTPFEGVSYMEFLIPGLVMLGLIQNSFQNSSSSVIIAKFQGTISDLLVVPMKSWEISGAFMIGGALRGLLVGVVTYITAWFFIPIPVLNPLLAIAGGTMIGMTFASFGAMAALHADDYDEIARYQNFVILPLVFLGGVFFSINDIPDNFQWLAYCNPIFYMIDVVRYAIIGVADFPPYLALGIVTTIWLITCSAFTYVVHKGKWIKV